MVKQLDTTRLALGGAWDKRSVLLTQCHNLQVQRENLKFWDSRNINHINKIHYSNLSLHVLGELLVCIPIFFLFFLLWL